MNRKTLRHLALIPAAVTAAMGSAHAALDAAVTSAIDTAKTDLLSLYGTLMAAGVAIWVAVLIYRKFKPK